MQTALALLHLAWGPQRLWAKCGHWWAAWATPFRDVCRFTACICGACKIDNGGRKAPVRCITERSLRDATYHRKLEVPMEGNSSLPSRGGVSLSLDIGRAYNATDAAALLGITPYVLNERVRESWLKPVFETGDRRYSGYALAQLLGWPLSSDPRDYLPAGSSVATCSNSRPMRRVRIARCSPSQRL